jgi:hypothetical protein
VRNERSRVGSLDRLLLDRSFVMGGIVGPDHTDGEQEIRIGLLLPRGDHKGDIGEQGGFVELGEGALGEDDTREQGAKLGPDWGLFAVFGLHDFRTLDRDRVGEGFQYLCHFHGARGEVQKDPRRAGVGLCAVGVVPVRNQNFGAVPGHRKGVEDLGVGEARL